MSRHGRLSRRDLLKIGGLAGVGAAISFEAPQLLQSASAAVQVPQTPLPGANITRFVTPLPTFVGHRVSGTSLQAEMFEFQQLVLPNSFYSSLLAPLEACTYLWGFATGAAGSSPKPQYPGVT